MMVSSKTRNYHIDDNIYNLCKDNIFQIKKQIKFISIAHSSFINYTSQFGHYIELIYASVKPYHIVTLNKQLDKDEQTNVWNYIHEQCLITILEFHNIKRYTNTWYKKNYTRIGTRLQSHKDKLNKEANNETFRCLQNTGTPEVHSSMTSYFNVTKKCGHKVSEQGAVDDDKQTESVKNL